MLRWHSKLTMRRDIFSNSHALSNKSLLQLAYEATFYKLCGQSIVVRSLPVLLQQPVIGDMLRAVIRWAVFPLFCGGETYAQCIHVAEQLQSSSNRGITSIVDHCIEEEEREEMMDVNADNKMQLIEKSMTSNKDRCLVSFVPLKCTSLVTQITLEHITGVIVGMHFTPCCLQDIREATQDAHMLAMFERGLSRIERICRHASSSRVSVLLDAEQTHLQPAVEVIYRILAQTFNNPAAPPAGRDAFEYPVVFNTYQMYLRRTSHVLEEDLRIAQEQGLVLAVKLVRGAYMKSELRRLVSSSDHEDQSSQPCDSEEVTVRPLIHSQLLMTSKQCTDEAYNTAAAKLIDIIGRDNRDHHDDKSTVHRIPAVALLLATHNKESVARAIDRMAECSILPSNPFVQFAQIRGMSDHVTLSLASHQYRVSKLLLFGSFTDVLPWLLRRLDENQVRK